MPARPGTASHRNTTASDRAATTGERRQGSRETPVTGLARLVRSFRRYHKWVGLGLAVFFLISALSGVLLAWKKDVGLLQPPELKHGAVDHAQYLGTADLVRLGNAHWAARYPEQNNRVKRVDIKLDSGIVKLLYADGYWEAQVHPVDGSLLSLQRRHADWIEALHDGSIISDNFKLVMMTLLGIGLCAMAITGFYLWQGPRKIRKEKRRSRTISH